MLDINFVPEKSRKKKSKIFSKGVFGVPNEVLIGIGGGIMIIMILVHGVLALLIVGKMGSHKKLNNQWSEMKSDKETIDKISKELKALSSRAESISNLTMGEGMVWSSKLMDISSSVPKGVWLRRISFENELLLIEGSAVSKFKNEMLTVSGFVSQLKQNDRFSDQYESIELGVIQRRRNTTLALADFTVEASEKAEAEK